MRCGLRWCSCQTYWAAGESFNRHFRPYASERTRTHIDRCTRLGVDPYLPSTVSPSTSLSLSPSALAAPTLRNSSNPTGGTAPQPPRAPLAFSGNSSAAPPPPCFCLFCPACGCRGGACRCSCPPSCAICHSPPSSRYTPLRPSVPCPPRSPAAPGLSPFSLPRDPAMPPPAISARVWRELPLQFWPAWRASVRSIFSDYLTSSLSQRSDIVPVLLALPGALLPPRVGGRRRCLRDLSDRLSNPPPLSSLAPRHNSSSASLAATSSATQVPSPDTTTPAAASAATVRRALALLSSGQLRKAASSLLQRGLHSPTPDVVDQLRQLHPHPLITLYLFVLSMPPCRPSPQPPS